jgi:hypothetical protein
MVAHTSNGPWQQAPAPPGTPACGCHRISVDRRDVLFEFRSEPRFWHRGWTCIQAGLPFALPAAVPFWLLLRRGAILLPRATGVDSRPVGRFGRNERTRGPLREPESPAYPRVAFWCNCPRSPCRFRCRGRGRSLWPVHVLSGQGARLSRRLQCERRRSCLALPSLAQRLFPEYRASARFLELMPTSTMFPSICNQQSGNSFA